ncbi:hypothetical protein E4J66_00550 [Actinomyces viscosus]|uniref:Uncharacterized protein n=1 Tax=Actinomyces viscosus TaxID=1656 RepID=A0A3S4Z857_ACTVI|nr:hypothetical protein [Actinomyces viscosus]TFH54126.1 hypothetical protein E4J66_00550 [Actinomyces viscosus]VEI15343.1 Uncharacterised protein [Actinomyces viscosus]
MSQTGTGCRCGCGGHGQQGSKQDERAAAPEVAQPLGEDHRPAPVQAASPTTAHSAQQLSPEAVDPVAIASAVTTALGAAAPQGVTPGHKAGNLLGLRDISAPASSGGGCGCGGH